MVRSACVATAWRPVTPVDACSRYARAISGATQIWRCVFAPRTAAPSITQCSVWCTCLSAAGSHSPSSLASQSGNRDSYSVTFALGGYDIGRRVQLHRSPSGKVFIPGHVGCRGSSPQWSSRRSSARTRRRAMSGSASRQSAKWPSGGQWWIAAGNMNGWRGCAVGCCKARPIADRQ
jgi:hypothetical protein